MVNFEMD